MRVISKKYNRRWNKAFTRHLLYYFSRRYAVMYFDSRNLPIEGDSITVGNVIAVFHKKVN